MQPTRSTSWPQRILIAALGLLALHPAPPSAYAAAKTFAVLSASPDAADKQLDGVCDDGSGTCTLRAAIMEANAAPGSTITLQPGSYILSIRGSGEDQGATGDLDITSDTTIVGPATGQALILARGGWDDRIFDVHSGAVQLHNLVISGGNSSDIGGGLRNTGSLLLRDVVIRNNKAEDGGGIGNDLGGALNIQRSVVSGNTASRNGGGIASGFNGFVEANLVLLNSAIVSNTAALGAGGIATDRGLLVATNVTISGNRTDGSGGGITLFATSGGVELNNVTITNNTADASGGDSGDGGGVMLTTLSLSFIIRNTLIADNHDNSISTRIPECRGILTSQGFNLLGNTTGCSIVGDQQGTITGITPLLGPLTASAAGLVHPLLAASPAFDAGNPAAPGSGGLSCAAVDQLGNVRPRGARCDIGAVEAQFLADQIISFAPIADRTLGDAPFVLIASASSGLPVHFTSTTPVVCTVESVTSVITLLAAGICSVDAEIDADDNFNAATTIQSFAVRDPARQNQTISIGLPLILR